MKAIAEMSLLELAAFVCSHLLRHAIPWCWSAREGMAEKFGEFLAVLEG